MTASVDIIIPCYNTGRYLRQAIDSALAQTSPSVRVLVVDDGSTDDTAAIVDSYADRVAYLHQANHGLARARNVGAFSTTGDFVCFLDADDVVLPRMIQDQAVILAGRPEVGLVYGKTLAFLDEDIRHPVPERWRMHRTWGDMLDPLSVGCAIHLGSSLIRRSCLESAGLFPEDMAHPGCEDWEFWLRCALAGAKFAFIPHVSCLYRQHPLSMSSSEEAIALRESELMRRAVGLFRSHGLTDERQWTILGLGILGIALRWAVLDRPLEFDELTRLAENGFPKAGCIALQSDCFRLLASEAPCLAYLYLAGMFAQMGSDDLAIITLLKCGDLREVEAIADACGESELFAAQAQFLEGYVASLDTPAVSPCPPPASEDFSLSSPEAYHRLEAIVPHQASLAAYAHHEWGLLLEKRGEPGRAAEELTRAAYLNPNSAWVRFDLGRVSLSLDDYAGAAQEAGFDVQLDDRNIQARLLLAQALYDDGDYAGAAREAGCAVQLDQRNIHARLLLAQAHGRRRLLAKGLGQLLFAARLDGPAVADWLRGFFKTIFNCHGYGLIEGMTLTRLTFQPLILLVRVAAMALWALADGQARPSGKPDSPSAGIVSHSLGG